MKNKWLASGLPLCVLLASTSCLAEEDIHFAVDLWGASRHADRKRNYNEQNWGIGVRGYYGNWFVSLDRMRNSVNGYTRAVGFGYEYPVVKFSGYTLSLGGEAIRLDYQIPDRGTLHGSVLLPELSIRKGQVSGNIGFVPPSGKRKSIFLFFATWHFGNLE